MAENAGVVYENFVKKNIRTYSNNFVGKSIKLLEEGGGQGSFNSHDTDLALDIDGKLLDIEIKKSGAQMGETSFRFDPWTGFEPVDDSLDSDFIELIEQNALYPLRESLLDLLTFFQKCGPGEFHSEVVRIPFRVTKDAWLAAKNSGLLTPINKIIPFHTKLITDHYNKKGRGCFYIQIEGKGLFYMGGNPFDLPIPALEGTINAEIRLKRAGSKINKSINEKVASATLIAAGRLTCNIKSPYSLDNANDFKMLFS